MKNRIKSRIITGILSACMLLGEMGAPLATYAAEPDDPEVMVADEDSDAFFEEVDEEVVEEDADQSTFVPVQGIQMFPDQRYFEKGEDTIDEFISFKTYPVNYTWKELKAQGYTLTAMSNNSDVAVGTGASDMNFAGFGDSSAILNTFDLPNINEVFPDGSVDRTYLWVAIPNKVSADSFTITAILTPPSSSASFTSTCTYTATTRQDLLGDGIHVTDISNNGQSEYEMGVGRTELSPIYITPDDASIQGVTAYSNDPSIVKWSGSDEKRFIAVSEGTTTVCAETNEWTDGNFVDLVQGNNSWKSMFSIFPALGGKTVYPIKGKQTSMDVTVKYYQEYRMRLSPPMGVSMREGDTSRSYTIAESTRKDIRNIPITFTVQDPTIVRLNDLGMNDGSVYIRSFNFTGLKPGKTTFKVEYTENDHTFTLGEYEAKVTEIPVAVTGVTVSPKTISMKVDESKQISATVSPDNAANKGTSWTSSDPEVVSIVDKNNSGSNQQTIVAHKAGTATITATTEDGGKTDTCTVTVTESVNDVKVTSVSVSPTELTLKKGATGNITATVLPENATNKNVSFTSTKPSVATVSDTGVVTAVAKGEATIIVTTEDGGKTAMCSVTVTEDAQSIAVNSVSLDVHEATLKINETKKLTATITPENATNQNVSFKSNNPSVASVSADGTVTAIATGEAEITVTTEDGAKTDKCVVTVTEEEIPPVSVNGVSLTETQISLKKNDTKQLRAVVLPEDATNKNVSWTSDKTDIATVDETGIVTAVAKGEATITVTTEDGGYTASCKVTVTEDSEPVDPEDPKPDPKDEPESDLGEDSYDDISDYTEPHAIYLVKGQKVRIPGSTVTTNDKKVAAISKPKAGYTTLTAKKNGVTQITLTNVSGNTVTHTVYVENPVFTQKSVKLSVNESQAFGVNLGANTEKYTVYYRSSNQDIAYVAEGRLYAISKGSAKITAYINGRKFTCKVTVTDPVSPKSVDSYSTLSLVPGQQVNLKYNSGFKAKGATWNVVDADPLKPVVSIKGSKVTAVGLGKAQLAGKDKNGTVKTIIIEVKAPATQTLHLNIGSKKTAKFYKLTNKKATWTSADTNIATVNNGTIMGINPGTTTVTAVYSGVSYVTVVTVEEPILIVSGNLTQSGKKYALNILSGESFELNFKNVSQAIAFNSDKPEIARVNNHGRIIASSAGKAKITAKINGVSLTIIVNVFDKTTNGGVLPAGYANSAASYEYDEAVDYSREMGAL